MLSPLSNHDIQAALPGVRIVQYKDLMLYDNIDDVFGDSDTVILFINQDTPVGHWVSLHRTGDVISYFDSYGKPPDSFKITPKLKTLGITYPHLTWLLYYSDCHIEYFPYRMQGRGTATCGRWAMLSVVLNELSDSDFRDLFHSSKVSPDVIATWLTTYT